MSVPRRILTAATVLALQVACGGDKGVVTYNDEPAVSILEPIDSLVVDEGEPIYFSGVVADDRPVDELLVEWTSSIDGILPDLDPPEPDGYVDFSTASLSEGVHVITLRATDADGAQGEDEVAIEVLDVPDLPSITVEHPQKGELGLEDSPFIFMATVDDEQDTPEDLLVDLVATPGGLVCELSVDGSGTASCAAVLPIGAYVLTFTATDTEGNEAEAIATYQVVSPLDYDADGDGYSLNGGDCNDSNATVYPGAPEQCDGLDNDCIESTPIDVGTDCYDDDGDGYCESPPCVNATESIPDCDDTDANVSPATIGEEPNHKDDDCDGTVDEGTIFYDDDGDGTCEVPPCENAASLESDCNDGDYDISPLEPEICGDDIDQNCDGDLNGKDAIGCLPYYYDGDADGYGVAGSTECWCGAGKAPWTGTNTADCYDSSNLAYPGASTYHTAHRGDGSYDYDCNGSEDKQYRGVSGGCNWEIVDITCDINGAGWQTSEPACGVNDQWIADCDASYDALCYLLCLASPDPIGCLISSCGASCDPELTPTTQSCR